MTQVEAVARPVSLAFPATQRFSVSNGNRVSIQDLSVGDRVETLAFSAIDGAPYLAQTRFLGFLDRRANQETMFLRLEFEGNQGALEITPDHLLAVVHSGDLSDQPLDFVRARLLEPGSYLVLRSGKTAQVRSITSVSRTGAYGPLTESGTALVNGLLVSCYAHTESHNRAHRAMLPLRLVHRLYRWLPLDALGLTDLGSSRDGFHPYARFLYQFRECLSTVRSWLDALTSLFCQHVRGRALERSA
ncbi:hypothetical protein F1559_002929 [Cyanidiococcus yangmingshanensis]|uniref:Hint domain-containing protein n=1 Tax=Cyanidiococcus yangmingshanensis TaxID=2690220 RepID=A0A7J7IM24_9RHOD|nr:hypothetical protein F1559_002929 [Cyanidiococcus yangmingshanensis]